MTLAVTATDAAPATRDRFRDGDSPFEVVRCRRRLPWQRDLALAASSTWCLGSAMHCYLLSRYVRPGLIVRKTRGWIAVLESGFLVSRRSCCAGTSTCEQKNRKCVKVSLRDKETCVKSMPNEARQKKHRVNMSNEKRENNHVGFMSHEYHVERKATHILHRQRL